MATAKPSVFGFTVKHGGLRGLGRGLLLSEIYTLVFALIFAGLSFLESGSQGDGFVGFVLFVLLYGQLIGVIPSLVLGLIAGLLIARFAIMLSERGPAVASKLAAAVALALTLLVDLIFIFDGQGTSGSGYWILVAIPTLIFVFDAVRTTRKHLSKVDEAFSPGSLQPGTVNVFFWVVAALKLVSLAWLLTLGFTVRPF